MTDVDIIVVGAGPAGLAAATTAAEAGSKVLLLDEQSSPGGQIYRAVESAPPVIRELLGEDYAAGESLVQRMRRSGCDYQPGATIWKVNADGHVINMHSQRSPDSSLSQQVRWSDQCRFPAGHCRV